MTFEAFHDSTLADLLTTQAETCGDQPYLWVDEERWTYAQAEKVSTSLAAGLVELGLQPGDRLAVILPNIPAYIFTLFAAAKAGLILVPINVRRHLTEVQIRLSNTRPTGLVTFSDPETYKGVDHLDMVKGLRNQLPELTHIIALGVGDKEVIGWDELLASAGRPIDRSVKPGEPAAILHTLGRSGKPRGAVLAHNSLVRNAASLAESLMCTPNDIFLGAVPFTNAFGLAPTILACSVAGAQLVCLPRYRPVQALKLIERTKVTIHHGVPTMFALELNHPDFKPEFCESLRTGIMSGAPCPPDLVKRVREEMGCDLLLAYGLTEASPSVSITRFGDGPVTAAETVGRPHEGVELKVIDPDGETLPHGEEGELCVRGYNVMLGYWGDQATTDQVLDSEGWLHTGDLAIIDLDGPLRIVGRLGDVINRGGFKIHPGTVEMILRSHQAVREVAVVGVPDLIFGELTYACVVCKPISEISEVDLLEFAARFLADYAVPDRVLFFEALPRRGVGLIQKDVLRRRVRIRGHVWKFGRNIDTDMIIPARRCNTTDPLELAQYCMEDADPEFVEKMKRGDLIVAGSNFGCGSSREVAPLSIKAAGVSAVIAQSFARIFFRNAINIGLPILECPEAVDQIKEGDEVEVEPATGMIHNLTRKESYRAEPFPHFLQSIIDRGGLLSYVEERLELESAGDVA